MSQLSLIANAKDNIDIHITPIKDGTEINEATIFELIANSEFQDLKVSKANIKNAIAELTDVLNLLEDNQTGQEITYQILERVDANIIITIDQDEMGATAKVSASQGGKNLTAKDILKAAQDVGVKKGFSKDELIKLAHLAANEKPPNSVTLQIATGKLAINGKDAIVKPLVESAQSRVLRPKKRDDGSVDMRDLGDIICVKIGDPLAEKIPLTAGKEGYTVTANALIPEPGNDVELTPGDGTAISSKNENILISKKVGLPKFIPNGMEVDEVYKIKNVNIASGNINFTGSVFIDGDVNEGMKVIASGDVTVGGFVESATIEAGGDITIAGGIIGHKHDIEKNKITDVNMSVNVKAKGNIFAKYCQYAHIHCGGNIRIENQLLHSIIDVRGNLKVGTEEKANGKLIGGMINAGKYVTAGIIGAKAGSHTIISFNQKIDKIKEQLNNIDEKIQLDNDKTDELKLVLEKLKISLQKEKNEKTSDMFKKVKFNYQFHIKSMGELLLEKEEVENTLLGYKESVFIEAKEKLHHGVKLIVGNFHDMTRKEYGPAKIFYKEREVHIEPTIH